MKTFWKDYVELCKDTGKFYKKHWFGVIVMNVAVVGAEFAWYFRGTIKDKLESKFHKNEEEEA